MYHKMENPHYGARVKIVTDKDKSHPLTPPGIKLVQKVIETLLLYAC